MWQQARWRGRRKVRLVPAGWGIGLLSLLCAARAVGGDYHQELHVQRGNPGSRNGNPSPGHKFSHHGYGRDYTGGHRPHHPRLSPNLHSPANPNPLNRSLPQSSTDQKTLDSDAHRSYNPSDCSMYQQPHHAKNKTHVETPEEVDYLLCQYYGPWSKWRPCNRRCQQRRVRRCRVAEVCGTTQLRQHRHCRTKRGPCSFFTTQAVRGFRGQNRQIKRVRYNARSYTDWSPWSSCTRSCKQRRRRRCTAHKKCRRRFIQQSRPCTVPGGKCEKRTKPRPGASDRKTVSHLPATVTTPLPDLLTTTEDVLVSKKGTKTKPRSHRKKGERDHKRKTGRRSQTRGDNRDILAAAQETCGIRPPAKRGSYRIVGGQEAQKHSWPWQVAILTPWEEQYCAGTLIAPQWLLTAAHCLQKKNRRRRIIVRAGEHDLQEYEGSEQDVRPERNYPHPEFDYDTITNDIGLVRLKTPLENRTHPGYACLPEPGFTPDRRSHCYILGWGKTRNTHLFGADILHEAQVPLVTPRRCQKAFEYHINSTQMCAGARRRDACAGDSGGPLLCPQTVGGVTRWFLVGITSYGEGCGRQGKYGIYTRVTSYLDWIDDTIRSYR